MTRILPFLGMKKVPHRLDTPHHPTTDSTATRSAQASKQRANKHEDPDSKLPKLRRKDLQDLAFLVSPSLPRCGAHPARD